jgi:tetratricopeptide (TPR) repeat protein
MIISSAASNIRLVISSTAGCALPRGSVLILALALASIAAAQVPPKGETVITSLELNLTDIEKGVGASQRDDLKRAGQLLKEGKIAEGEALLDEAIAFFEREMADNTVDYVSVAKREQLSQYQKEHKSDRKLVWIDWSYGYALHKKGWIAAGRKRWKEAETWLDKDMALRPFSAEAYNEKGYVFSQLGRFDNAVKSYETALRLCRTSPTEKAMEPVALRGLGFALIELKDLPGARRVLLDSLRIDPNSEVARHELHYIRLQEGGAIWPRIGHLYVKRRWPELARELEPLVAAQPANAEARTLLASARCELGQWKRAVDDLEESLALDDSDPQTWYFLAMARLGAGEDDEYRRACERFLEHSASDVESSLYLIRACRAAPRALKDFSTVLKLAEVRKKPLTDVADAVKAREKAGAGTADAITEFGEMLYRAGRFDEAMQRVNEALKLRKAGNIATFFDLVFLAMAHQRLGQPAEARRFLSDARDVVKQAEATGLKLPWYHQVTIDRLLKEAESSVGQAPDGSKR